MLGETIDIDNVNEPSATIIHAATTTSSLKDEGYPGDYLGDNEGSEKENFLSSGDKEETCRVNKSGGRPVIRRLRYKSREPRSVPSSVVWYSSDESTNEPRVSPLARDDDRPEDNHSDVSLEDTLGELCQHSCCLPSPSSDKGQNGAHIGAHVVLSMRDHRPTLH